MIQNYDVNANNMDWLNEQLEKINKKAIKLGQPKIKLNILSEEYITNTSDKTVDKILHIEIVGETVKVEGYRFLASLDHTYSTGNIIRTVSDEPLDEKWRTASGYCEHCNTNRKRKTTVLLEDENGTIIQVGKTCLKDFIGYDINKQLKYIDLLNSIEEIMSNPPSCEGDRHSKYISVVDYLNLTHLCIKRWGWVSAKQSREEGIKSTAERALTVMFGVRLNNAEQDVWQEWRNVKVDELVTNALEWLKTEAITTNDYMHNLKIICDNKYINEKECKFVASLISTYQRHLDKEKEKTIRIPSEYVGNIGERRTFIVTVERILYFDTAYGCMAVNIMKDEDGNALVWKSSRTIGEENEKLKIIGTITEHSEYNGVKQTQLKRCGKVKI